MLSEEKRSFKNCGVSMSGSLTADTLADTDLRPSEAKSNKSVVASCTEVSHPVVLLRSSATVFAGITVDFCVRTFELVVRVAKAAGADGDAGDGDAKGARDEAGNGGVGERAGVETSQGSWADANVGSDQPAGKERHGGQRQANFG